MRLLKLSSGSLTGRLFLSAFFAAGGLALSAQAPGSASFTTPPSTDKAAPVAFDVATIRPSDPAQRSGGIKAIPGGHGYTARNVPVRLMIAAMYRVPMRQITGGPDWLNTQPWDVEARVDGSYNLEQLHTMYKGLLADRFGLKYHCETKEGNIYALTVDPSGLKMKPNNSPEDFSIPLTGSPGHIHGKRVSLKYLTWWLGQAMQSDERAFVNMTNLEGFYDFDLTFADPTIPDDKVQAEVLPSLFTALKEQLGLKLVPQKGPVEYMVIDAVQKPSEN